MKFTSILAITACLAVVVSAAPHKRCNDESHHSSSNHENNSNHEDNSNHEYKKIDQSIGSVGSTHNGLLGGLLGGGILSSTTNNNYNSQNAKND